MADIKDEATEACGSHQLFSGLVGRIEDVVHASHESFKSLLDETHGQNGFLVIDTKCV